MGEINLFCDVVNCGQVAHAFGMKGKTKEKCCQHHVMLLTTKKMSIYDISGYNFISSFEDVPIYEERRGMMERGLGNLSALEAQLDSELFEAQHLLEGTEKKAIAMAVHSYQEIRLQVQRKYETSKQQLQAMRHTLEQYLVSVHNDLQGNARLLCGDVVTPLKFLRLAAEDCMLEIAKVIGGSWRVSTEDVDAVVALLDESKRTAFIERLTAEATDELRKGHAQLSVQLNLYAHTLGWSDNFREAQRASLAKQVELVKELQDMFQLATDQSDIEKGFVNSIAAECFQAGVTARSELDFPQSLNWLQNAWDVLHKSGSTERDITKVGLALWEVLGLYFGKYTEAERILRRCYDIEAQLDPLSEDTMKVSNSIARVFYHSGNWHYAVDTCTWVLCTFSNTRHTAEHFWTTLLYLTHSYWIQEKNEEAHAVVETWKSIEMAGETELSEALKLTVTALHARKQSDDAEAEKLLIKATDLAGRYFPTSVLAALDYRLLGLLYEDLQRPSEAEEYYRKAKAVYEAVCPQSVDAANSLNNLGVLYHNLKRLTEAEEHYLKAKAVYEAVSPQSVDAAKNLKNLALLYKHLKRSCEAEDHYLKAKAVYEAVSPQSLDAADNLNNLALLYDNLELFSEAEKLYRMAKAVYEVVSPLSVEAANNLYNLGVLCKAMGKSQDALSALCAARTIYIDLHLDSDAKDAANVISRL